MYSINNVPLDNPGFGWRLLRRSQLILSVTKNLTSIEVPGRSGVLRGVPAFKSAPTQTLVVRTLGTGVETLYALFEKNGGRGIITLEDNNARAGEFELASITSEGLTGGDELVDVSVTLRFPTGDWRATTITESNPTVSGSVSTFSLFSGISSDINDAEYFISGNFGNLEIRDMGSGSWVKTVQSWPNISSTGLLIRPFAGTAHRATTAAPWTPISDVSEYIDVSGGGGFRLTPTWDSDPSARIASVRLTVTNPSGVSFKVRAYNAFSVRDGGV